MPQCATVGPSFKDFVIFFLILKNCVVFCLLAYGHITLLAQLTTVLIIHAVHAQMVAKQITL